MVHFAVVVVVVGGLGLFGPALIVHACIGDLFVVYLPVFVQVKALPQSQVALVLLFLKDLPLSVFQSGAKIRVVARLGRGPQRAVGSGVFGQSLADSGK